MTPACSTAHIRPVRPTPVATSSAIMSAPNSSHSARTPCRNAASWVSIPPAACTIGSTTTAQTWPPCALEQRPQLGHHLGGRARRGSGPAVSTPGEDTMRGLEQDRAVGVVEQVDAADADGAEGVAVVALGHVRVERPLLAALGGRLEGHLEGGLDRGGPVAGVEHPGQPLGRRGQQPLGERDAGLVGQAEVRRVVEPVELGPDGVVDLGDPVAVHGDPQRRDAVEVAAAVGVAEVHPLGAVDHERLVVRPLRVLGEGVPDVRVVAGHEVAGARGEGGGQVVGQPGISGESQGGDGPPYPGRVPSLAEIAARHTELGEADLAHLRALRADWRCWPTCRSATSCCGCPRGAARGGSPARRSGPPPGPPSSPTTSSAPSCRAGGDRSSTSRGSRAGWGAGRPSTRSRRPRRSRSAAATG